MSLRRASLSGRSRVGSTPSASQAALYASSFVKYLPVLLSVTLVHSGSSRPPRRASNLARRRCISNASQASFEDWFRSKGFHPLRPQLPLQRQLRHQSRIHPHPISIHPLPTRHQSMHHQPNLQNQRKDQAHRHSHRIR